MLLFGSTIQEASAQQPTTTTVSADRTYRGIIAYPGVPAANAKTWLVMWDSTRLAIHPPKIVLDSAFNEESLGNPENIMWIQPSDSSLAWSARDSLIITQNQVSGLTDSISDLRSDISAFSHIADSASFYTLNGSKVNQRIKILSDTISVTGSSNGFSIDISALGYTRILSTSVVAFRNTANATASPNVSIKSVSTSAIVVNIIEDNTATVSILGINVLSGAPSVFASVSGLKLHVMVIGY